VEGDSFLLSVRTVGIMLPLSEVKRPLEVRGRRKAPICQKKRIFEKLWNDQSGISSVEYALLLAFVATGIMVGAEMLSNAVSNEMADAAALLDGDGCSNSGSGDGTGGEGGDGQGGDNTC